MPFKDKPIIAKLLNKFLDLKIGAKITLYYIILLIFSIIVSDFLYQKINSNIMSHKVSDVSFQNLGLISNNIDALLDNVNNYSKMILSDENNIQLPLKKANINSNLDSLRIINRYLMGIMETTPLISSIYIFDNLGNMYGVDKLTVKTRKIDIKRAPWYDEVIRHKGGSIFKLNAGNIFIETPDAENFISLIRTINDLDSLKPIGILIVNISEKSFINSFNGASYNRHTSFLLKDENNVDIIKIRSPLNFDIEHLLSHSTGHNHYSMTQKSSNKWNLISYIKTPNQNWKIISIMPFDEISQESGIFSLIAFIVILINSLLIFLGSVFISKLITIPINKLLISMKDIEKGAFKKVHLKSGKDEIGQLKDGYNLMIQEIQKLIERIVEEQKIIRKAELDILQAQIKPHFLYNTFDAISSLALSGRNEDVYTLMKALGSYYRKSLSNGAQIISINDEVEIVKNYLTIQKIRYGEMFSVVYKIDERAGKYKIPKLILQPLVENALYHGIKPKGKPGVIIINVIHKNDHIELIITDDGIGMDEEVLLRILEKESKGFGLKGTIERLQIFYGITDLFFIASVKGTGTTITIKIPCEGEPA